MVTRRRGSDLEDAVYEATLAELGEHGMAGLTFERIAARAGAGKASLYRRWPDAEALVLAALVRAEDGARNSRHPGGTRLEATGDLRTELVTFLVDLADGLRTPLGRALTPLLLERDRRPQLWERIVALLIAPRQRLVAEALERAAARGEVRADAASPFRVSAGPALVVGRHLTSAPLTRADVAAIVDEVLLASLRPDAARGDDPT